MLIIKKEDVIEDIIHNDVSWTAVTSDLDDEDLARELLQHIVELWVTIRLQQVHGWSTTSSTSKIQLKGHVDYVNDSKEKHTRNNCFRRLTIIMYRVIIMT